MIQPKELRIGNLVYDNTIKKSDFMSLDSRIKLDMIKPIPLTEEWLLRFGFQKNEFEGFFLNGIVFYDGLLTANQKYKIKYVHQLQNLYFALTNKELEATY